MGFVTWNLLKQVESPIKICFLGTDRDGLKRDEKMLPYLLPLITEQWFGNLGRIDLQIKNLYWLPLSIIGKSTRCYQCYLDQICVMWLQNGINKHLGMRVELMTACVSQNVINYRLLLAAGAIQTNISALWQFLKSSIEFRHNRRTAYGGDY